ncbi:restriction endonuclease [Pseudaquabacterium rugosum]|uniref:Restriction endonuclease n=1 Tax=Pseudaquabacterium rugosum TaxID=2984194 RepID=A0ABU9BFD7_9BURK
MSVPTYDRFIEPLLRFLATCPDGAPARNAHEAAANALGLTLEQRQEQLPSGAQAIYKNRAGWAHDRLKRAGLSASPRRGHWQITAAGQDYLARHPAPLTEAHIEQLASVQLDVPLSSAPVTVDSHVATQAPELTGEGITTLSPDDRLEQALAELRQKVVADLLEILSGVSPGYFESIVLDVLHRMGYGANRGDLQRVGGSGDAGIDGVIALDRLGLEKVYVQAKRWQGTVGRPDIQAFYGALAGQRARKGVFITTSGYTAQAIDFARSVDGIVLVDGRRLADLMIEHEVGISTRVLKLPRLDSDYFDEDAS